MGLFSSKKKLATVVANPALPQYSALAELTLDSIADGVLLIDDAGTIKYANPAAAELMGYGSPTNLVGLDYQAILRLETTNGLRVVPDQSKLAQAIKTNQATTIREYVLVSAQSERKAAIAITVTPTGGMHSDKILTFRNITEELKEEQQQSEFISTASHEMRTPVASIEGYLGLALNPQTASIDARARQYLEAAHEASKHLGRLFKDLLDVTKLDDGHLKVHAVPVEIVSLVRKFASEREKEMQAKHLKYSFGTSGPVTGDKQIDQLVYAAVDIDFLREIIDNLVENAIKYTPEGGEIWVNARGDGDKVLINVTDTGIGVSPEDAGHIFQKFYRADNSQTRQIGGTGLGLYLVRQRVEAMGGRVWVESSFGDGSTFYVSLPRLTNAEYQKMLIAYQNEQTAQAIKRQMQGTSGAANGATASSASVGTAGVAGTAGIVAGANNASAGVAAGGAAANEEAKPGEPGVAKVTEAPKPVPAGPLADALVKAAKAPASAGSGQVASATAPAGTPGPTSSAQAVTPQSTPAQPAQVQAQASPQAQARGQAQAQIQMQSQPQIQPQAQPTLAKPQPSPAPSAPVQPPVIANVNNNQGVQP